MVAADLVELAGGPDAIIARAEEKLAQGDAVAALHLLDVVFAGHGQGSEARGVATRAHEALLQESDNFWLSSWLRKQIALLQTAPG